MSDSTAPARESGKSTGELVQQVAEQLSRLIRDEIKLAKLEMTRKVGKIGKGAGFFGGGGVIAFYGAGCLFAAAIAGIAVVLPVWAAALIVGGGLLVIAGLAALLGKREVGHSAPLVPEQAIRSTRTDVETIVEGARQ